MISKFQPLIKNKKNLRSCANYMRLARIRKFFKMCAAPLGVVRYNSGIPRNTAKYSSILSGKNRGVYCKHTRLSRHEIKAYMTYIKGLRKSSW